MPKKSGETEDMSVSEFANVKPHRTKRPSRIQARVPRRLKLKPNRLSRSEKRAQVTTKLPNVWALTMMTWRIIWANRKLFFGITLVYGLLNLVLVQGLASANDVTTLKAELNQAFSGQLGSLASSLSVFAVLVGSAGNGSSQTAAAYQLFLWLTTSLAVIWALRQVLAGKSKNIRIRDTYYQGMYPLVPFLLVLLVVGLQLIPLLIGSSLYNIVISNGIAVYFLEKLMWGLLFLLMATLSLYMISSSLFALYIVTLPDMTPMSALRSAKGLVRFRRWAVIRKVLCLPIILLVAAAVIMVPIIIWLTPLAQWVFFLLSMFAVVAVHSYMYVMYREMLNE